MRARGFTLTEVMFVTAMLTVVIGSIYQVWFSVGNTAALLDARATANAEALRAGIFVARELRGSSASLEDPLPGPSIAYRVAEDRDGNGLAIDAQGRIELSGPRTISRDTADANHDGRSNDQLVLISEDSVQVLANGLRPDEDLDGNGQLDPGEDVDKNGQLDRGVWFEPCGNGVRVTVQTMQKTGKGYMVSVSFSRIVAPRNHP